jgi:hypothetical protein
MTYLQLLVLIVVEIETKRQQETTQLLRSASIDVYH